MRVAAVQFEPRKGAKAENLRRLAALAAEARGADLVVLPEMAATGYVFAGPAAVRPLAEEPARGETLAALGPVARALGAWLVVGLPEVDRDRLFNSALVVDPAGAPAFVYRKTLLYEADLPWAAPGDSGYRTFDTPRGAFGVGVCMDLNDDRFVAWVARAAPRALAFPTNWVLPDDPRPVPEGLSPVWPYWAARLAGTRTALVAANRWGEDEGVRFSGASAVLDLRDDGDGRPVLRAAGPRAGDGVLGAALP